MSDTRASVWRCLHHLLLWPCESCCVFDVVYVLEHAVAQNMDRLMSAYVAAKRDAISRSGTGPAQSRVCVSVVVRSALQPCLLPRPPPPSLFTRPYSGSPIDGERPVVNLRCDGSVGGVEETRTVSAYMPAPWRPQIGLGKGVWVVSIQYGSEQHLTTLILLIRYVRRNTHRSLLAQLH